jgi:hypothetical protein
MARISALALDLLSPAATLDFCRSAAVVDALLLLVPQLLLLVLQLLLLVPELLLLVPQLKRPPWLLLQELLIQLLLLRSLLLLHCCWQ